MISEDVDRSTSQLNRAESPTQTNNNSRDRIIETLSPETFDDWYEERKFAENIRKGMPYFNGPNDIRPPERHTPSSLLQCHRKISYKQLNAPAEKTDPTGIFWIGSRFEEDIALPFLRESIVCDDEYVTNSLWVEFTVQTEVGEIHIKGETDPVIVDQDAKPLLLTEIKTKDSVGDMSSPSPHHKAQAHAYMKGLSEKYDRNITDAVILYGSRTKLNLRPFHVEFDPVFWRQTIVNWAETQTEYRLRDELPPAEPEYEWECTYCPYRERCGQGELGYSDVEEGLLPGFAEYPRSKVTEYLEAHDEAKLTPTLAREYPTLTSEYPVSDWECRRCGNEFDWQKISWEDGGIPTCPNCGSHEPAVGPNEDDSTGSEIAEPPITHPEICNDD